MRLPLANTLKTRSGDHVKDARNVNGYPDVKEGQAIVRKRPGCKPTSFNFTTPLQGFSSIADLMTYLPYGNYGDISTLMFSIYGDYYYIPSIWSYQYDIPSWSPSISYPQWSKIWYAYGAYNEELDEWLLPSDPNYPPQSEWTTFYAYEANTNKPPSKTGPNRDVWGLKTEYSAQRYYLGAWIYGPYEATRDAACQAMGWGDYDAEGGTCELNGTTSISIRIANV